MHILNHLKYSFLFILILYIMIISPDKSFLAAKHSVELFLFIILPSLFPFMILIDLLLQSKFLVIVSYILDPIIRPLFNLPGCASIAIIFGFLSGYPGGAIMTAFLREKNLISLNEAQRLIAFCNNASPIFITGAIGTGLLNNSSLGLLLLKTHILASLTIGIFYRFVNFEKMKPCHTKNNIQSQIKNSTYTESISLNHLTSSIYKNSKIMVAIGTYIILFGILIQVFKDIYFSQLISKLLSFVINLFMYQDFVNEKIISQVLCGLLEISNGLKEIANENLPVIALLPLISLILGWGSLSVHFQVLSILRKTDIPAKVYIYGKILHGILSAIYTLIFLL